MRAEVNKRNCDWRHNTQKFGPKPRKNNSYFYYNSFWLGQCVRRICAQPLTVEEGAPNDTDTQTVEQRIKIVFQQRYGLYIYFVFKSRNGIARYAGLLAPGHTISFGYNSTNRMRFHFRKRQHYTISGAEDNSRRTVCAPFYLIFDLIVWCTLRAHKDGSTQTHTLPRVCYKCLLEFVSEFNLLCTTMCGMLDMNPNISRV